MTGKSLKVYIVEDEPLVLNGYIAMLKANGFEIAGYSLKAMDAIHAIPGIKPDICIMDINLPDLDGISTVARIQSIYRLPCILVTGYNNLELADKASQDGIYGYLRKPVDEIELVSMINIAKNNFEKQQQLEKKVASSTADLENRKLIERAKGVLMDEFSMKEGDAMKYLQKKSRDGNVKLVEVAQQVLAFLKKQNA